MLHNRLGKRALDYFGWEFASNEENPQIDSRSLTKSNNNFQEKLLVNRRLVASSTILEPIIGSEI